MAIRRADTYTIDQLTDLEEQASAAATEHLFEAADWLTDLFDRYDIPHAFMGGFALQLRGSRRATQDLDVATGCTMLRLLTVLREQTGVLLPSGLASGVLRIFIGVRSSSQLPQIYVHADLILEGGLGVPRSMDNGAEMLTVRTPSGEERRYRVLNLRRQAIAKLRAADSRRLASDFDDILFLATTYPDEVAAFRNELDRDHRQVFINELYSRGLNSQMLAGVERTIGITGFREEQ